MKFLLRKLSPLVALMIITAGLGCAGHPVNISTPAPQKIDRSKGHQIQAKACGFQLLLFIPISINGRAERAYGKLLGQARGDYVTDVKIRESWFYGFIGSGYCTEMQATAYPRI